jgi:hypothetical protein
MPLSAAGTARPQVGVNPRTWGHYVHCAQIQAETLAVAKLILRRASASRPSGEWNDDDYDVLADGVVVGRIFHAAAAPVGANDYQISRPLICHAELREM